MAYDEELAHRTRELLADQDGVTEKRMFGGLAFLLNGNMSVAVSSQGGLLGLGHNHPFLVQTIVQLALRLGYVTAEEFDHLVRPDQMVRTG